MQAMWSMDVSAPAGLLTVIIPLREAWRQYRMKRSRVGKADNPSGEPIRRGCELRWSGAIGSTLGLLWFVVFLPGLFTSERKQPHHSM